MNVSWEVGSLYYYNLFPNEIKCVGSAFQETFNVEKSTRNDWCFLTGPVKGLKSIWKMVCIPSFVWMQDASSILPLSPFANFEMEILNPGLLSFESHTISHWGTRFATVCCLRALYIGGVNTVCVKTVLKFWKKVCVVLPTFKIDPCHPQSYPLSPLCSSCTFWKQRWKRTAPGGSFESQGSHASKAIFLKLWDGIHWVDWDLMSGEPWKAEATILEATDLHSFCEC